MFEAPLPKSLQRKCYETDSSLRHRYGRISKTVISAALTDALNARTGSRFDPDWTRRPTAKLCSKTRRYFAAADHSETWLLKTPASPHLAARIDGIDINTETLEVPTVDAPLVIEGAGGLHMPLTRRHSIYRCFALASRSSSVRRTGLRHHQSYIAFARGRNGPAQYTVWHRLYR